MEYKTENIRNILFLGHQGSGKTSLIESLLSKISGNKKGEVEKKDVVTDFTSEERNRLSSCSLSVASITYNDYRLNFLDAPGNDDFVFDIIGVLRVIKAAVLVLDASKKIEVGTIKHFNMLKKNGVPTFIFINKMDKELVDFDSLMSEINARLGKKAVSFVYPIGHQETFDGFINVVELKARKYNGFECVDDVIYDDKKAKVMELHNTLAEQVALTDDALLDRFFNGETLTNKEINDGLHTAVVNGEITPVLFGSAKKDIGINTLLNMMISYLPNPAELKPLTGKDENGKEVNRTTSIDEPFSAYIFKTTYDAYKGITNLAKISSGKLSVGDEVYSSSNNANVKISAIYSVYGDKLTPINSAIAGDIVAFTKLEGVLTGDSLSDKNKKIIYPKPKYPTIVYHLAVKAKNQKDDEKLATTLNRLAVEEPCMEMIRNQETKQMLLGGLSDSHLAFIFEKVKNIAGIEVVTSTPKINYRETLRKKASAEGRYVKQSGGSGFYGVVVMDFGPSGSEENIFSEEVFGGAVPRNYFPAVEKGFIESTQKGLLAGYPVIGVKATLLDGKYHAVDSNEQAFKMAAILAYKEAYDKCSPTLLEPIMEVRVQVGSEHTGSVMKDLSSRRGRITSMDDVGFGNTEIIASVPEAEILDYAVKLRVMTQGGGFFNRKFESYQEVPSNLIPAIIDSNKNN